MSLTGQSGDSDPDDLATSLSNRFFDRLHIFAARRLRDAAAAEEVAQEALSVALQALREGRIRNVEALPAFLFETARNYCLHRQRAAGREARALQRVAGEAPTATTASDPLRQLLIAEEIVVVQRALGQLDAGDREILMWSYRDGLEAAAIGERLQISPGAVRVRRHRALNRLAVLLGVTMPSGREHK